MLVLGIETTCDETAAAVVERQSDGSGKILSNIVRSQTLEHDRYRLASPVCRQCLSLWLGSGGPSGPGDAI